jgi:hypothetical protein
MDFRDSFYCGGLPKSLYRIQFWLYSEKTNGHFTWWTECFYRVPPSASTLLMTVHWGCHGSEVKVMPFVNCAQEISQRASNIALYMHFLSSLMLFCKLCVILSINLFTLTQTSMENKMMVRHLWHQVSINPWKNNQIMIYFHREIYRFLISYCVVVPSA